MVSAAAAVVAPVPPEAEEQLGQIGEGWWWEVVAAAVAAAVGGVFGELAWRAEGVLGCRKSFLAGGLGCPGWRSVCPRRLAFAWGGGGGLGIPEQGGNLPYGPVGL